MHLPRITSIFALVAYASAQTVLEATTEPTFPGVEYLYTAYADCANNLYSSQGPRGIRKAIPIIGGNFTGPRLAGTIRDLGADWGLVDVQTGIFTADTRYNLVTDDGANILLQTSGPGVPGGGLHLRVLLETGDERYYWLNNIVAFGVLQGVGSTNESFTLKIDVWHMKGEYTNTTFLNGTVSP